MKLSELINQGQSILKKSNNENAKREAIIIIKHVIKIKHYEIYLNPNKEIHYKSYSHILSLFKKRAKKIPIAYILNSKSFYKSEFYVDKNVLIPRPETEHIIDTTLNIINKNKKLQILDIGIGSGAILLTLLFNLPKSYGIGTDISINALKVAQKNLNNFKLHNRCHLINTNWAESLISNNFDLLVCNPPYIRSDDIKTLNKDITNFEPHIALDGGKNGLECLTQLLPSARKCIKLNGSALFEVGYDQSKEAQRLIMKNNFKINKIIKDFSGYNRIILTKAI